MVLELFQYTNNVNADHDHNIEQYYLFSKRSLFRLIKNVNVTNVLQNLHSRKSKVQHYFECFCCSSTVKENYLPLNN